MTRRGWVLFLVVSTLWGLPYFFIRIAVRELDPFSVVLGRTLPAALVLLPLAWRSGALRTLKGKLRWLLVYTVVEFGIPWYFMTSSEQHLSSSFASLLVCATPLIGTAVSKALHPHQRIGGRRIGGLALGALGVVALVGIDIRSDSVWAVTGMSVVALGYALGPQIISARLSDASGLAVVAASVAIVAVAYAPLGIGYWPTHVQGETWLALTVLSVACTMGSFLAFFALIKEVGPSKSVVVTFLNTAIAVLLGVTFLHEPMTIGILIGFPVIAAGSYFATTNRPD